jgi:hypothetical protein
MYGRRYKMITFATLRRGDASPATRFEGTGNPAQLGGRLCKKDTENRFRSFLVYGVGITIFYILGPSGTRPREFGTRPSSPQQQRPPRFHWQSRTRTRRRGKRAKVHACFFWVGSDRRRKKSRRPRSTDGSDGGRDDA